MNDFLRGRKFAPTKKDCEGSITVFLSLVICLILALIGTTIESARVNIAGAYAERSLLTAMDSEFTKYQEELYQDYHLFLLERNLDIDNIEGEEFLGSIEDYLLYSFEPNKDLELLGTGQNISNLNLLDIQVEDIKVSDSTVITDYSGELFLNEVTEYMKYKIGGSVAENFLEKFNLLQKTKETVSVVKEKLQVEKKLGELDKEVMDVMEIIEGITFNKGGLQLANDGLIKTQSDFAKKFCSESINKTSVGVDHYVVWNSLKEKYVNPLVALDKMKQSAQIIKGDIEDSNLLRTEIDKLKDILTEYDKASKSENAQKDRTNNKTKEIQEYSEDEIQEFREELDRLEKAYEEKENKSLQNSEIAIIKDNAENLIKEANDTIIKIKEALNIIPIMDQKCNSLTSTLNEFGVTLDSSQDEIDSSVYDGLTDDYEKMKHYLGESQNDEESIIEHMIQMEPILVKNKTILEGVTELEDMMKDIKPDSIDVLLNKLEKIHTELEDYSIKRLNFNYDGLVIKEEGGSPFSVFSDLIQDGILGLVVDDIEKISKNELDEANLPSQQRQESVENDEEGGNEESGVLAEDLKQGDDIGYEADLSGSLDTYESSYTGTDSTNNVANELMNNILLNEYITQHFKAFTNSKNKNISSDSVMEFEQEYILCGNNNDYDNIKSIVLKTVFIRTVLNYLYLISDSSKSNLAYTTALGLVGFTCLQPLVSITKHLILITWAFEEALVDTRALLEGKKIPLIKNKNNFMLEYSEILLINKALIKEKAKRLPEEGEGGFNFGYEDYIKVYLLLTGRENKCYRAMDLIQENIKTRYSEEFDMSNCVYGVTVKADFLIPAKFIKLPFVNSILHYEGEGFRFNMERDYSY